MKKQLNQLRRFFARTGARKLNAATAREVIPASYDDDDNSNRLSGAFIVVLALHVIALVGVFAFSRMKDPKPTTTSNPPGQSSLLAGAPSATPKFDPTVATPESTPTPAPALAAQYASLQPSKPASGSAIELGSANDRSDGLRTSRATPTTHIVKSGENLTKIAVAHSVNPADLKAANNLKSDEIRPGQELVIPTNKAVRAATTPQTTAKATTPVKVSPGTYTVKKNDTLVKIARNLNVSYEDLTKLNGIKDPRKLQEGQVLKVPKRS